MRSFVTSLSVVLGLCSPVAAFSQSYSFETYGKEVERGSAVVQALDGFGQFGESIDFNSGAVAFRKTVVDLRGNNSLRVAADYEFKLWDRLGWYPSYHWRRATPYIVGIHSTDRGWVVGNPNGYSNQRCSDPLKKSVASVVRSTKPPIDNYLPEDYWDGNSLVGVEGAGTIRPLDASEPTLSDIDIKWATNSGWRFSCYILPDGSEGFVGHRPNGEKYYFGIPQRSDDTLQIMSNFHYGADTWLDVSLYKMYLVRVEDRYGNWVNYDTSQISSSDGRIITFEPSVQGPQGSKVSKVKANGREWSISSQMGTGPQGIPFGNTVTNPDGSTWSISNAGTISESSFAGSTCEPQQNIPLRYNGQLSITVTLESGATGVFTLQPRRHGYSNVGYSCLGITSSGPFYSDRPHFVDVISLVGRTMHGPGLQSVQHTFNYGGFVGCYAPVTGISVPDACTTNSPNSRSVTVTTSTGKIETHVFGNKLLVNAGLLLSHSIGNLETTTYEYALPYRNLYGLGKRKVYDINETYVSVTKRRATTVDGRNFVWMIASDCGASANALCIDHHFRPIKVTASSGP